MFKKTGETEILRCSFCNKYQNDVRMLIAHAQRLVQERFSVQLEPEIGFIGEF